jgi:hypothetical protein
MCNISIADEGILCKSCLEHIEDDNFEDPTYPDPNEY